MKRIFLVLLYLISFGANALEWAAQMRESWITPYAYGFNSDSSSRVRRELQDRGYNNITMQPAFAYAGDTHSRVIAPQARTSARDLMVMSQRIAQAQGHARIQPIITESFELGIPTPKANIKPSNLRTLLYSYDMLLRPMLTLARHNPVQEFIVLSGTLHLLNKQNIDVFLSFLQLWHQALPAGAKLGIEISNIHDLSAVREHAHLLKQFVDIIHVAPPYQLLQEGDSLKLQQWLEMTGVFATKHFNAWALSQVILPSCHYSVDSFNQVKCIDGVLNHDIALKALQTLTLSLKQMPTTLRPSLVSVLEATTDFEPYEANRLFPYFNHKLDDPSLRPTLSVDLVISPPYKLPPTLAHKSACIYYDQGQAPAMVQDFVGPIHAVMLESLLGAFKNWDVVKTPTYGFHEKQLSSCDAVFYLGTNFMSGADVSMAKALALYAHSKPLVWMNYHFANFTKAWQELKGSDFPFTSDFVIQADSTPSPSNQDPGFYRFFDYKGETFSKLALWSPASNNFAASPELNLITLKQSAEVKVLAQARHSKNQTKSLPYAVNSKNVWFIADSPFSFVHYEDRMFIFVDLLWDILKEEAPTKRIALLRFEDINPTTDLNSMRWAVDWLSDRGTPFSLALIPYFSDTIGAVGPHYEPTFKPITAFPSFIGQLKYSINRGADIVMHGVAHSVGSLISGYDGISGGDYEFWLYPENRPLPFDSLDWVIDRLELGEKVLTELNIKPLAFEIPHYAASVLNYRLFGKLFEWNYHRSVYFPNRTLGDSDIPSNFRMFECYDDSCKKERRELLRNVNVDADYEAFGGMILPLITYKDAYGQSIIPETLGMIDFAFYATGTWRPISFPEDVIRRAKKLKVIRGAVASFFWHPQLLNPKSRYYVENPGSFERIGGKKTLTTVVKGLEDLGYEFISISDDHFFPRESL